MICYSSLFLLHLKESKCWGWTKACSKYYWCKEIAIYNLSCWIAIVHLVQYMYLETSLLNMYHACILDYFDNMQDNMPRSMGKKQKVNGTSSSLLWWWEWRFIGPQKVTEPSSFIVVDVWKKKNCYYAYYYRLLLLI